MLYVKVAQNPTTPAYDNKWEPSLSLKQKSILNMYVSWKGGFPCVIVDVENYFLI